VSRLERFQANPAILRAVEQHRFRVTVGDVSAATGLGLRQVEQGLLALAANAGGHLQVAEDGEMAYVFPRNLRAVRLGRVWRRQLQSALHTAWKLFLYLLKISFGIVLISLIVAVLVALIVAMVAVSMSGSNSNKSDRRTSTSGGPFSLDAFLFFDPSQPRQSQKATRAKSSQRVNGNSSVREFNFLEAVFSFLFGDGNPNADLEERRWQAIASVIRHQRGVIVAEQLTPYLDQLKGALTDEDYVLPTLVRFNGQPHVSPEGDLVYAFPELQVTAGEPQAVDRPRASSSSGKDSASLAAGVPSPPFLREEPWPFSRATTGQQITAGVLGGVLLALSICLHGYVSVHATVLAGWLALFSGLATVGIAYSLAYLLVPLVRYLWLLQRNKRLQKRNTMRQARALTVQQPSSSLSRKLAYAHRHGGQRLVDAANLAYTSEKDLMTQEAENADKIDAEWQRRLKQAEEKKL